MRRFKNIILPGENRRRKRFYLGQAKLAHIASLASFMAGFVMKSIANLQIHKDPDPHLLTAFVVVSSILVTTSSFAILISLWILPLLRTAEQINEQIIHTLMKADPIKIDTFDLQKFNKAIIQKKYVVKDVENGNYEDERDSILGLKTFKTHRVTIKLVETAWILAGSASVFLFTIDVIILCWIKFRFFTLSGTIFATVILTSVILGLAWFGIYFRFYILRRYSRMARRAPVPQGQRPNLTDDQPNHSISIRRLSDHNASGTFASRNFRMTV